MRKLQITIKRIIQFLIRVTCTIVTISVIACSPNNSNDKLEPGAKATGPTSKPDSGIKNIVEDLSLRSKNYIADVVNVIPNCHFVGEGDFYTSLSCQHLDDLDQDYIRSKRLYEFYLDKMTNLQRVIPKLESDEEGFYELQARTIYKESVEKNKNFDLENNELKALALLNSSPTEADKLMEKLVKHQVIEVLKALTFISQGQLNAGVVPLDITLMDNAIKLQTELPGQLSSVQSCDWEYFLAKMSEYRFAYKVSSEREQKIFALSSSLEKFFVNVKHKCGT